MNGYAEQTVRMAALIAEEEERMERMEEEEREALLRDVGEESPCSP